MVTYLNDIQDINQYKSSIITNCIDDGPWSNTSMDHKGPLILKTKPFLKYSKMTFINEWKYVINVYVIQHVLRQILMHWNHYANMVSFNP